MKRFILAASALMIAACSQSTTETRSVDVETTDSRTTVTVTQDGDTTLSMTIRDGYVMAPLKGRDVAAGYFVAENTGNAPVSFVSASADVAASVELHTHSMEDGVMKMREVAVIDVAAGETVEFKPGSFHLMMFGFDREEGQTAAEVTLTLASGDEVELALPIRERE